MTRLLVALTTSAAVLSLATAAPVPTHLYPKAPPAYYPTAVGTKLVYDRDGVDEAWVGGERATPQPGRFYGGWVTSRIVGPIKGEPGTTGW